LLVKTKSIPQYVEVPPNIEGKCIHSYFHAVLFCSYNHLSSKEYYTISGSLVPVGKSLALTVRMILVTIRMKVRSGIARRPLRRLFHYPVPRALWKPGRWNTETELT